MRKNSFTVKVLWRAQVAQRGGGVSSGGIEKPHWHLPVWATVGKPALAGVWLRWSPEVHSKPYDFVILWLIGSRKRIVYFLLEVTLPIVTLQLLSGMDLEGWVFSTLTTVKKNHTCMRTCFTEDPIGILNWAGFWLKSSKTETTISSSKKKRWFDALHCSSNTRISCQQPFKVFFIFTLLWDPTLLDRIPVPEPCFFLYTSMSWCWQHWVGNQNGP